MRALIRLTLSAKNTTRSSTGMSSICLVAHDCPAVRSTKKTTTEVHTLLSPAMECPMPVCASALSDVRTPAPAGLGAPQPRFQVSLLLAAARASRLSLRQSRFHFFVCGLHLIQFQIGQPFYIDHLIPGRTHGPDQLVQLQVDGARIAVLRVLDQEDHQKRRHGRSRTDSQRPFV